MITNKILNSLFNLKLNKDVFFNSIGNLSSTENTNILSWIFDKRYIEELKNNSNIKGVITTREIFPLINHLNIKIFISKDPMVEATKLINQFLITKKHLSKIHKSAKIHKQAYVSKYNVEIGKNVIIEANASIAGGCIIKDNCIIRSGAIIGGDNFGHIHTKDGKIITSNDSTKVILNENVEVGHLSCIDRGDCNIDTVIERNTKIHQGVQICHGNYIGQNSIIWGGVFISGFCKIGNSVKIQPKVTISNNINIGNNVYIGICSLVTKDISDGKTFFAGRQFNSKATLDKLNLNK